jgi:hypothetical protein
MVNYRPPPEQLAKTQLSQVSSWCRYDPMICLTEVGIEAGFIAAAYCAMLFLTGGNVPGVLDILKFLLTFTVLSVAARMISDDLGNKLSISAVSGIGSKTVSMLAPRFVGW